MSGVILDKIVKSYGAIDVVHGIDLEVQPKEFVVLVGPSGCGKSTTLRMIAGLEEISGGDLTIAGRHVNRVAPKDRDVAMVFQNYALYPHLNVAENIAFGLRIRKESKEHIASSVEEVGGILGLTPYLERRPADLSGGQRQRVAMGRAIVRRPKVFLFDEPLSNLDAKLRTQMRAEIRGDATAAYQSLTPEVTLAEREVYFVRGSYFVIVDKVDASEPVAIEWLLHANQPYDLGKTSFRNTGKRAGFYGQVVWSESGKPTLTQETGFPGVDAKEFEGLPVSTCLHAQYPAATRHRIATLLVPYKLSDPQRIFHFMDDQGYDADLYFTDAAENTFRVVMKKLANT